MKKPSTALLLAYFNLVLILIIFVYLFAPFASGRDPAILPFNTLETGRHVLYIGLNDRYTYAQIIPTEEAIEIVTAIAATYVSGWTMGLATGGWVDENGVLTQETSLVWTFIDACESEIIAIMEAALVALNQNSILVERSGISYVFYSGGPRGD